MSWLKARRYKQFAAWCEAARVVEATGEEKQIELQRWLKTTPKDPKESTRDFFLRFFEKLERRFREGTPVDVIFDRGLEAGETFELKSDATRSPQGVHIANLQINPSVANQASLLLSNISISRLTVHGRQAELVKLRNCKIYRLLLADNAEVEIQDTEIGILEFAKNNRSGRFNMSGGCILDIACPLPGEWNPIGGPFNVSAVFLPRNTKHYLLRDAQPYRSISHHLLSVDNSQMANVFHSAQLAVERKDDPKANKLISWLYQLFSDFGSSALRPFLWWLGILLFTFGVAFYTDGARLQFDPSSEHYSGWRSALVEEGLAGRVARSIHLALQPVVNPLGIYSTRALLVPKTHGLVAWLLVHALLSLIFIALTILAIRRRFKMH